jgi:hypothetical protein
VFNDQCTQLEETTDWTTTVWHTGHITTHYMVSPLFFIFSNWKSSIWFWIATTDTFCLKTCTLAFIFTYILPHYFYLNLLFHFICFQHYAIAFSILIHCTSCCYYVIQSAFLHLICYTYWCFLSVIYFRYTTHSIYISSRSEGSKMLPDDGRLLLKHVGANT